MQSMDALLFYPRKTDGKAEPWGKRFALCAEHPNRSLGEVIQVSYGGDVFAISLPPSPSRKMCEGGPRAFSLFEPQFQKWG